MLHPSIRCGETDCVWKSYVEKMYEGKGSSGSVSWCVWMQGQRDNFALGYSLTLLLDLVRIICAHWRAEMSFLWRSISSVAFFIIGFVYQCCNRALKSWPQLKWHTNTGINTSVHFKYRIVLSLSTSFFRHRPVFQPVLLAATHLSAGLGCSSALLLLVSSPLGPLASHLPLFLLSLCCLHLFPYPWLPSLASVTFKGGWGSFDGSRPPCSSASSCSSLLHQSRLLFSKKKKVPFAELKNNFSAPKAGHFSSPGPSVLGFWVLCSSQVLQFFRPLADTWHPLFGRKGSDFIVLQTLQRSEWKLDSLKL